MALVDWLRENFSIDNFFIITPNDLALINKKSALMEAPKWARWANYLEFVLFIFGLLWFFLCLRIFYEKPMFHRNLIGICINVLLHWTVMQVARFTVCIGAFFDEGVLKNQSIFLVKPPFAYVEFVRLSAGFGGIVSIATCLFERLLATERLGTYEQTNSCKLITSSVLFSWTVGFIGGFGLFYSPLSITMSLSGAGMFCAFIGCSYRFMSIRNKHLFHQFRAYPSQFNLSQRFQLQENIRVLAVVRRCILMFVFCVAVTVTFFAVSFNFLMVAENQQLIIAIRCVSNLAICLMAFLFLLAVLTGTHVWRESLRKHIKLLMTFGYCQRTKIQVTIPKDNQFLWNLDGRQLSFNQQHEKEMYFRQLSEAWK